MDQDFEIYSVDWEYEDQLPEISDLEYDLLFVHSQIRGGVRMFPYIKIYDNEGNGKRIYLGA